MAKAMLQIADTTADESVRADLKRQLAIMWATAATQQFSNSTEAWLTLMMTQAGILEASQVAASAQSGLKNSNSS